MKEKFTPPFPKPQKNKASIVKRFFAGRKSWLGALYEKSYTMMLGEVRLPKLRMYIANEKKLVKQILEEQPEKFPKHRILHEILEPLIGESIFTTNGEKWQNHRKMINPSFTHTNLKKVFGTMDDAAQNMLGMLKAKDLSQPVDVEPVMTHVTADVIFRTIFSVELTEEKAAKIFKAFHQYQKYMQRHFFLKLYSLFPNVYNKRLRSIAAEIHDIFRPILRERFDEYHSSGKGRGADNSNRGTDKKNEDAQDILDSLLAAKHPETGDPFSFQDLIDQISLLFLAGHETSASALTWSLYLLSKCPHLQDEINKEIAENCPDGIITNDSIKNFENIKQVFMETLRLYPPISFFAREVVEDTKMRDKILKKDSFMIVSPWLIHRSPNHWQEPNEFNPCRFADEAQKESVKCSYMPFAKGQRVCIGAGFATQEAILIIANIVKNYKISYPVGAAEPEPINRATTRPKDGMKLILEKRYGWV